MQKNNFTIRVYGIVINELKQVLVCDELIRGNLYTKFVGGGLEYGEGTRDCLQREFLEETGEPISIGEHFYTTDFFMESVFAIQTQVISIYYRAEFIESVDFINRNQTVNVNDFDSILTPNKEIFRWVDSLALDPAHFSFPIDQHVAGLIKEELY